jgi:hypothetical protein
MPLEDSCNKYKGQIIYILPKEGYGWSQRLPSTPRFTPGDHIETPEPFFARVLEFCYLLGHIRAGICIIEQKGHLMNKQWMAFCVRDGMGALTYNLSNNPAQYNISIGKVKPTLDIDTKNLAMPEWMRFEGFSYITGIAYIVEEATTLKDVHAKVAKMLNSGFNG